MIKLALTKGRLENSTIKLLQNAGIDCLPLLNKGRKLVVSLNDTLCVVFAKAADVVTYVEHGVCDVGVVGRDTLLEMDRPVHEILDLGFGKCRFSIAGFKANGLTNIKTIATKYPEITRRYFEGLNMDVSIVKIEGSVELAPLLGLCDAIADLVETGDTLRENGLEVLQEVENISARLIVNTASLRFKRQEIENLARILGNKND